MVQIEAQICRWGLYGQLGAFNRFQVVDSSWDDVGTSLAVKLLTNFRHVDIGRYAKAFSATSYIRHDIEYRGTALQCIDRPMSSVYICYTIQFVAS